MNFTEETKDLLSTTLILLATIIIVAGLLLPAIAAINSAQCEARWKDSYQSRFSVAAGCQVLIDNRWIPDSAVREDISNGKH